VLTFAFYSIVIGLSGLVVWANSQPRYYPVAVAVTLGLWLSMMAVAIWSAALLVVREVLVEALEPADARMAIMAVRQMEIGFLPAGILTALAFFTAGMILVPIIVGGGRKRRPKLNPGPANEEELIG
jgi:hypothetical protein